MSSKINVNSIEKQSGNNIAIDDSLNLKSFTTTQRNALTSAAGDMIYNSTTNKAEYYNGSAWIETGGLNLVTVSSLIIAGGGGGGRGGGGAGGYINSYGSEQTGGALSTDAKVNVFKGVNFTITVGAGGAGVNNQDTGVNGSNSVFSYRTAVGGGGGGYNDDPAHGGSGGGGRFSGGNSNGGGNNYAQGFPGGKNHLPGDYPTGGGGGAGAVGQRAPSNTGGSGDGGVGLASSITGSAVNRAGGGGGGAQPGDSAGSGGTGGGGNGTSTSSANGSNGTANTGGGGGGTTYGGGTSGSGGNGGSGVVILRWTTADATISIGAGLVSSTTTSGSDSIVTFTSGSGTVSFS